jgi:hypothetical protein
MTHDPSDWRDKEHSGASNVDEIRRRSRQSTSHIQILAGICADPPTTPRLQRVDTVQRRSSDTDESGPLTAAPTCISSCNG